MSTFRTVKANDKEIHYQLERKPVKNLNLRIRSDRSIYVSANSAVPIDEIDLFVISKASYISDAIERFNEMAKYKPQPKQYVSGETFYIQGRALRLQVSKSEKDMISSDGIYIFLSVKDPDNFDKKRRMVNRFLNKQCRLVFEEIIHSIYPVFEKYGVSYPNLRIRSMETRWGSCLAKKGIITLNKRLLEAPRNCIEYVVMHEFCHFIHPNHSKRFYSFLSMLMPDWKKRKALLEKTAVYWL
jgi:predicted metal-dependent hydrolase